MRSIRPGRVVLGALTAAVLCAPLARPAMAAIDWGPARNAGPPSTWSAGNTLARADQRLLTAWSSDCPPPKGRCAGKGGPSMGVFVQRAALGGPVRWSVPVRVSQPKSQAERASIAADGRFAITGWVVQRSYTRYRPGAPRAFYVRRSRNRGASWSKPSRLSLRSGRVDYPQLAVSGTAAYAVWTNADSGTIRLAMSGDAGRSWTVSTVGKTTARPVPGEGFGGYPTVGASGSNVVVAWLTDGAGMQVVKSSNAGGSDLTPASPADTLAPSGPHDGFHYAVARGASDGVTDDVAIAYTTAGTVAVRVYDGAVLGAETRVLQGSWPTQIRGRSYGGATGPVAVPFGADGLTVAFSACRATALTNDCRSTAKGARSDLLSSSSSNGGLDWTIPTRVGQVQGPKSRINDAAGLVVTSPSKRFVLWNARDERFLSYRMRMRIGTGSV